jgi:hypothetical protein
MQKSKFDTSELKKKEIPSDRWFCKRTCEDEAMDDE